MAASFSMVNVFAAGLGFVGFLLLPITLVIVLLVTKKLNGLPFALGLLSFFVSQVVLRIPLLQVAGTLAPVQAFAQNNSLLYLLIIGGFTAGLFEETARLAGATILKKNRTYKDAISFGLGHGLCEVLLLMGMAYINNLLFTLALAFPNSPFAFVTAGLDANTLALLPSQLAALTPLAVLPALLERVSAVTYHVFGTVLVFWAVKAKKPLYYGAALLAHTLFNFVGVLLAQINLWLGEAAMLVAAVGFFLYIRKARGRFDAMDETLLAPAPETAPPTGKS